MKNWEKQNMYLNFMKDCEVTSPNVHLNVHFDPQSESVFKYHSGLSF